MIKVHMKFRKDTKGTHVYEEVTKGGNELEPILCAVPSLYIRKSAMPTAHKRLTVIIEVAE